MEFNTTDNKIVSGHGSLMKITMNILLTLGFILNTQGFLQTQHISVDLNLQRLTRNGFCAYMGTKVLEQPPTLFSSGSKVPAKIFEHNKTSNVSLLLSVLASISLAISHPNMCQALDEKAVVAKGKVEISDGVEAPTGESVALFITARPKTDGIFAAKPVAIASAKFESPTFPFEFALLGDTLTPEGKQTEESWLTKDLTVSCRLDTDGVAFTRDPEDLVGQAILKKYGVDQSDSNKWQLPTISLQGRGVGGKMLTQKSK